MMVALTKLVVIEVVETGQRFGCFDAEFITELDLEETSSFLSS